MSIQVLCESGGYVCGRKDKLRPYMWAGKYVTERIRTRGLVCESVYVTDRDRERHREAVKHELVVQLLFQCYFRERKRE